MNNFCADMTFGIGGQAIAVAAMLKDRGPDFAEYTSGVGYLVDIQTAAWYNGRERGVIFSVRHHHGHGGHIAVFEHRNSDCICAVSWATKSHGINPPALSDVPDGVYESKWDAVEIGKWGEVGKAADWVYEKMGEFYNGAEASK